MSNCCSIPKQSQTESIYLCIECGAKGRSVEKRTVFHHVKNDMLWCVSDDDYRFCSTPSCTVVYYGNSGKTFTMGDVRELVTAKATGDTRPLCYCFGFTEGDLRKDLVDTGETTIPSQISNFIREKLCACEIRNPSGACCLGQINQTVKRLTEECKALCESELVTTHYCCQR